jgi:hypothetical protein
MFLMIHDLLRKISILSHEKGPWNTCTNRLMSDRYSRGLRRNEILSVCSEGIGEINQSQLLMDTTNTHCKTSPGWWVCCDFRNHTRRHCIA